MPIRHLISLAAAAALAVLVCGEAAQARLLIEIDKTTQRMTVSIDGHQDYQWTVATGGIDYDTPNGVFKPFRMDINHHSQEWDNAPMPYSIFFTDTGNAIHGTYERRSLGHPVSHGCVRLSVAHAAALWGLVKREKMANTTVVITGDIPGARPPPEAMAPPDAMAPPGPMYANAPLPRFPAPLDLFSFFH